MEPVFPGSFRLRPIKGDIRTGEDRLRIGFIGAEQGDADATTWLDGFVKLGEKLKVKVQINSAVTA